MINICLSLELIAQCRALFTIRELIMSILKKLKGLNKAVVTDARVEMNDLQVEQCKAALRRDNRGYNVQPNRFDIATPYRVAINYQNEWHNFGNFKSADVAAAVGTIVSVAFFGAKAVAGNYDEKLVESNEEFLTWISDERNIDVIAKANGDTPSVNDGGTIAKVAKNEATEENPF